MSESTPLAAPPRTPLPADGPHVDVVIPVYNESAVLRASVERVATFLESNVPFTWRITIADNGSTDGTGAIAQELSESSPHIRAVLMKEKGRGRALRTCWIGSDAAVVAYMDVDLSTDLAALCPLVTPLLSGEADVAIGTRLSPDSRVVRGAKREFISRTYNHIVRLSLGATFSDAQCGFKALRADVANDLLPFVDDQEWFFDTELLVAAARRGLRISEVPVNWTDDPDSRVRVVKTATDDLLGIARLLFNDGRLPSDRPLRRARANTIDLRQGGLQ